MNKEDRLQLENECLMKYSKAQMIQKYIDELEESSKLSELWCKSQKENQKYKEVIDKAIKKLEQEITFCQNESQGLYDKCNIAINREQRILDIFGNGRCKLQNRSR